MLQVLGPDRFSRRQASGSTEPNVEKRKKVESTSEASIRRGCLADWMELSVHVNPSMRQTRQRPLPRGLQDRYTSSVRQYLTQTMLQKGKEADRFTGVEAANGKRQMTLEVLQVHEGQEGVLLRAQVVQGCLSCNELPEGSSVRLLLHQKHPALQVVQLCQGAFLQVVGFSVIQANWDPGYGALLLPIEVEVRAVKPLQ